MTIGMLAFTTLVRTRKNIMSRRPIAFLVAPLAVPTLLSAYVYSGPFPPPPNTFAHLFFFSVGLAYAGTAIFGVPIYLFLSARRWTAFWIAPIVGFVIGTIMWIIFLAFL